MNAKVDVKKHLMYFWAGVKFIAVLGGIVLFILVIAAVTVLIPKVAVPLGAIFIIYLAGRIWYWLKS